MNNVITVLATMANNPNLTNGTKLTDLLANPSISEEQKQAIIAQDSERLAETIIGFPLSMCAIISPAEDEQQQESQEQNKEKVTKNVLVYAMNG